MGSSNRKKMTTTRRRAVYAKYGYKCHACGVEQVSGFPKLQIDHWVPLFLGGSENLENLRPLCEPCHKRKTQVENKVRGKINRLSGKTKKRTQGRKLLSRTGWGRGEQMWPKKKSQWPKGRKIPSRPFEQRSSRS